MALQRVSLGWLEMRTASRRPYRTHPCYSVATIFSLYPARVTIATVVNRRQYYANRSQSNLTTVAPKGTASLASGLLMLGNFEILQMNPHYSARNAPFLCLPHSARPQSRCGQSIILTRGHHIPVLVWPPTLGLWA